MTVNEKIEKLAAEKSTPCVTISLNTHRTHPDNAQDAIRLKNFLKEAEERVTSEFGKREAAALLEKISSVQDEVDVNYNLDSLHIFLSADTKEIIKSIWPTSNEGVQISESFAIRPLVKIYSKSEEYLIMLLSQSGVTLYQALNDQIISEIKNDDFPFSETPHYNTNPNKISDSKHLDDLVREFFNKVDKALVKFHNDTNLNCVVICTEDNYSRLMQVADKPSVYIDYASIDYNSTATHHLASQGWEIVNQLEQQRKTAAIDEMREAVAQGKVLTDLQEIFQASIDGRGEILVVNQDFSQPVVMNDDRSFDLIDNTSLPNTIDDITSTIAWEVLSKKGKVYFTSQEEIADFGEIVLKTRY